MINHSNNSNEDEKDETVFEEVDDIQEELGSQDLVKKLRRKLKECESLKQEYLLGWQRTKADFLNIKRKESEERESFLKFASSKIIEELIPILDSFEMAFKSKPWQEMSNEWKLGIQNIRDQLKGTLSKNGVEEIKPEPGDSFDPNFQEAIEIIEVKDQKNDNKIIETVQSGYKLNGRLIRTAKVKVGEYQ